MSSLYCPECSTYLMAGDGECHDCHCGWKQPQECECEQAIADYEEVLDGHRRLTRELDVLLNGEEGAAQQASLCDLVGQLRGVVALTGKPVLSAPTRQPDDYQAWYEEAMVASNEAGFAGMSADQVIRYMAGELGRLQERLNTTAAGGVE